MIRVLCVFLTVFLSIAMAEDAPLRAKGGVVFASPGGRELTLDWYRPDDDQVYPGILTIHGGGWMNGTPKGFTPIAKQLAAKGYVVANISYRLAGEAKFPAAVLDCKAAVRWMRVNAKILGVNPEKIGAVGGSAGGHLAAMMASTGDDERFIGEGGSGGVSDTLNAVVIMGAGVDQVARVEAAPGKRIENCVVFFGGEYSEVPEIYALGSPITHITIETVPVLMLDGGKDRPGERYTDYRKKLDQSGVKNEFAIVPDARHGEWGKEPFRSLFVSEMAEFFRSLGW